LAGLAFPCNARPQVFSFVLFAFFCWVLEGYRFNRRNKLWMLPFAMVLWVNLHGAFALGLGLVAVYLVSGIVFLTADRERPDALSPSQIGNLGITFVACAAATLANPQTYRVYDYIHTVLSDQASQRLVMEWQPPRIDTILGIQMFFGLFGLAILGLIYSRKRPDFTDLGLFLFFSIVGLTALRSTIWFAIVIAPILCRYWAEVEISRSLKSLRHNRLFDALPSVNTETSSKKHHSSISLCVLFAPHRNIAPWLRPRFAAASFGSSNPIAAINYLSLHRLQNIFHPQIFGDYLIWRLYLAIIY
jgi:hypothetical protein